MTVTNGIDTKVTSVSLQFNDAINPITPIACTKLRRKTLTFKGTESDTFVTSEVNREVICPVSVLSKNATSCLATDSNNMARNRMSSFDSAIKKSEPRNPDATPVTTDACRVRGGTC